MSHRPSPDCPPSLVAFADAVARDLMESHGIAATVEGYVGYWIGGACKECCLDAKSGRVRAVEIFPLDYADAPPHTPYVQCIALALATTIGSLRKRLDAQYE